VSDYRAVYDNACGPELNLVARGDGCAGDCSPCCGFFALAIALKELFFRTLPRRGQRTPLRLLVSPSGSLVFAEGDRLSNSFGLWALRKTGGVRAFLFAYTNRTTHARSYQSQISV